MELQAIDRFDSLDPETFKQNYYLKKRPVIIKDIATSWPAYTKWDWNYFKQKIGDKRVGIYNNIKSNSRTPINKADDFILFGEYIDKIKSGPVEWRIFLFNIFEHCPELTKDFTWPETYLKGFAKKYPMLFTGGATSITHLHFDIDLSNILHTQFVGKKKILLFPFEEQHKLYRKPYEVLSLIDFTNFDSEAFKLKADKFPALRYAKGFHAVLEHGDTLYMPAGYWHHMEYLESGFAVSLRALQPQLSKKLAGIWNLFGMRSIDTILKTIIPDRWYQFKLKKIHLNAEKVLAN